MRLSFLICISVLCSACIGIPPTEVPLPSIKLASPDARNDTVIVMFPGRGDRADSFVNEGFDRTGQEFGLDTIATDAHFGYYMKRSLTTRLHEDIVLPARKAGYEKVWLLGISMGGFGSLLYASEHPEQVDGVILLAPFLGNSSSIKEVVASGGLKSWDAQSSALEDYEIAVWTWLRDSETPVILGYGESDDMADGYRRILTDVLEPSSVYTLEGGHKWTTWKPLWDQIAADLEFYSVASSPSIESISGALSHSPRSSPSFFATRFNIEHVPGVMPNSALRSIVKEPMTSPFSFSSPSADTDFTPL